MKLDPASQAQVEAARPDASTWVSANAGSGKTRVLTDRVARLLLAGTEPQKILCLTYTRAAASVMQNRLFEQLGLWAMTPEQNLREALAKLGEDDLGAEKLARARTLFARALETPGGLKIQTIHSLCDSILRQFPLEAGVPVGFELMEERQSKQLRSRVLEEVAQLPEAGFEDIARYVSGAPDAVERLLKAVEQHRQSFGVAFDREAAARALGIPSDLSEARILGEVMRGFDDASIADFAEQLAKGGTSEKPLAEILAGFRSDRETGALDLLESVFLTQKGEQKSTRSFPTNAVKSAAPWTFDFTVEMVDRVHNARKRRAALRVLEKSTALHRFAGAYLARYAAEKAALGRLDYDDQIQMARRLLTQSDMAQWVLFRLDGGIDHILVDEAQDTSPDQWDIVEALAAEFTAGEGRSEQRRTIFVVGDEKQSIYSFQGADPQAFGTMRSMFEERLLAGGSALNSRDLLYSFRSARPILELVDRVFRGEGGAGVSSETEHRAFHEDQPGRVDLWPAVEPLEKPEEKPWYLPVDAPEPGAPRQRLARAVAGQVQEMLREGTPLHTRDGARPARAGDFLILVQGRQEIFHAIIKELKAAGVPVAGADRERITASLAVRDLLALLQFVATPEDDLSLASALRSPLFDVSESELFGIAHGRKGTLWSALRGNEAGHGRTVAMLSDLLAQDEFLRPFELLEQVLTRHDGRRRLLARLGHEAEEAVDELLSQALAYEAVEAPSLTGFLEWITSDDVEVKRQMEETLDQVRVMTVHGAKGLEAPIVILPDTFKRPGTQSPEILTADGIALWAAGKDGGSGVPGERADHDRRQAEERRRLLYVAMTRAENWLIVCGARPARGGGENWYDVIARGFEDVGALREPAPDGLDGEVLSLRHNWEAGAVQDKQAVAAAPAPVMPDCLRHPAPPPPAQARALEPSDLGGAHTLGGDGTEDIDARRRGAQIHLLLEVLPDIANSDRRERARLLLGAGDLAATPSEFDDLFAEASVLLDSAALAPLFSPGALREVPVVASLPELGGARILGRIDCLVVAEDSVLLVDFKSHRLTPARPADTPEGILRQLGAYRAALAQQYPSREICCAVLWTRTGELMELPQHLVDEALSRTESA